MSVKLLDANGLILHSNSIVADRAGNQTEEVSIDGSLNGLAMTIGNE
jgi:hypothetical protein